MQILNEFYADSGPERVGFVVGSKIVEVRNTSNNPEETFVVSTSDILTYGDIADATWHTHPNQSSNLSDEDYTLMRNYPNMSHFIIGNDGVTEYKYDKKLKAVMVVENG